MSQQAAPPFNAIGVYLNPEGQQRVDFQAACAEQFGRLFLADGTEQATLLLAQQPVDLLVIDLERFEHSIDLDALRALVKLRAGAAILVICPLTNAGWLPELMACGPLDYAIAPLQDAQLRRLVSAPLASPVDTLDRLRALQGASARVQQAISDVHDPETMADQICVALGSLPDLAHASLFYMHAAGELELAAQYGRSGFNLTGLLHSPMRDAFPGLLAATSGDMVLFDAPAKAGDPELAVSLSGAGIEMVLGLPLPPGRAGALRGSLCLMFEQARQFSEHELASFLMLAQLAGMGLRMADMARENEQLLGRLTHIATTDALTGVANRRHGEALLELETRRARRYKLALALITFDIDRFKDINDRYGHPVGDGALRAVAEAAQAALRNSDVLVRSGGDEFQIIAPHTSAIDALKIAEKIRLAIANAAIPGCDQLTVSLGVGQVSDQESPDALMVRVDAALARAKRAGRNCVELAMQ